MDSPHTPLPRDPTGRYLHLQLKRFASANDLLMPYARRQWKEIPHDAEIAVAARPSTCRHCLTQIPKGALRVKLYLQCHKGCKNAAMFHFECLGAYPEFGKLESVHELHGLNELPEDVQKSVVEGFAKAQQEHRQKKGLETEEDPQGNDDKDTNKVKQDDSQSEDKRATLTKSAAMTTKTTNPAPCMSKRHPPTNHTKPSATPPKKRKLTP